MLRCLEAVGSATVVVAVSGGSDSAALLLMLDELRRKRGSPALHVAHLHHGIRGVDADADRDFVERLARRLGLPFTCEEADVPAVAGRRKLSLEHAARECRYEFLKRAAEDVGAEVVALGHTADDQVETVLHHLQRGAGIHGLAGMPDVRPIAPDSRVRIVRPLLDVTRRELTAWLERRGESWRTDRTNVDVAHTRNRIRHRLIPALRENWPTLREDMSDFARTMRALDDLLEATAREWLECESVAREEPDAAAVDAAALSALDEPLASYVIRELIARTLGDLRRIDEKHVAMIDDLVASGATGASLDLPRRLVVRRDYGTIRFALRRAPVEMRLGESTRGQARAPRRAVPEEPITLAVPGRTRWGRWTFHADLLEGEAIARELRRLDPDVDVEPEDARLDKPAVAHLPSAAPGEGGACPEPVEGVREHAGNTPAGLMSRFIECLRGLDPKDVEYLDCDRAAVVSSPLPPGEGRVRDSTEDVGFRAELIIRSRRDGDRFTPLGAPGQTKLKDFFIRRKVPRAERDEVPLIVGRQVLMVTGHGVSDIVALCPWTRRILRIKIEH